MSAGHRSDAFAAVVGHGRGLNDPGHLRRELAGAERELADVRVLLSEAEHRVQELDNIKGALTTELDDARRDLGRSALKLLCCARDRDMSAYAAMRAGARDPVPGRDKDEHHGVWTRGRPYLAGQHVWAPRTHVCFQAREGGAPVGAPPGDSRRWVRCRDGTCPDPAPIPVKPHPVSSGYALRQSVWWWDKDNRRWAISDLDAEHLLRVIDYLRDVAHTMYAMEFSLSCAYVPCPVSAYPTAPSWLADTPLMEALLTERRRRGLRHPRRKPRWRPDTDF